MSMKTNLPVATVMATVADNACTPQFIASLHRAGMTGVRINSANATPASIARMVGVIRSVDPSIVILMDTKGAEIRTTATVDDALIRMNEGEMVTLVEHADLPTSPGRIAITASGICGFVPAATPVLLDDGEIELVVCGHVEGALEARVVKAGMLGARKTVTFRGVETPEAMPALTERDREAIAAGIEAGIDIIAHSFVRSADDVMAVRRAVGDAPVRIFSKIECVRAVDNFRGILEASDGLLCARGDLGSEVGIAMVPVVQMETVKACRKAGKPVIVATQFLQSMMSSPAPTRAEAGDIAAAVMQGADTLLLCGETALGKYPRECVEWMKLIIDTTAAYRDSASLSLS